MSDPTGPSRRRRIAGESKPAAPAKKPAARKVPARKAAAKKAALQKATPSGPPPKTVVATKSSRSTDTAAPARTSSKSLGVDLRWFVPAALVAVAVLVLGAVLTVQGVQRLRGADGELESAREQAASAAGSAMETIFTYRYDQLDQHLSSSTAVMTKKFAKTFEKYEPALVDVAAQRKVQMRSVTQEAAALPCGDECSPTKIKVLVFYDQVRLTAESKTPTVFSNRASVSLVKTDEGWLVDDIRAR